MRVAPTNIQQAMAPLGRDTSLTVACVGIV